MPLFNIICISKTLLYDLYFLDSPRQKVSVKFWQSPRRDYFLPGKSLFIITVKEFRPVFSIYQVSIFFFFFFLFFLYHGTTKTAMYFFFNLYHQWNNYFHKKNKIKNKKSNKLIFLVSSFDGPPRKKFIRKNW
jgi:predicted membrane protein